MCYYSSLQCKYYLRSIIITIITKEIFSQINITEKVNVFIYCCCMLRRMLWYSISVTLCDDYGEILDFMKRHKCATELSYET